MLFLDDAICSGLITINTVLLGSLDLNHNQISLRETDISRRPVIKINSCYSNV